MECKECKECNVHACEKNFELCDYLGSDVIFGQATKFLTGDDAIICNVIYNVLVQYSIVLDILIAVLGTKVQPR